MPISYGSVKVARVKTNDDVSNLIKGIIPKSEIYFVKPNWYSPLKGNYTDAKALDLLLSALPGKKIIIEGYSIDRQDGSEVYRSNGVKVDWKWLLKNPELDWLKGENLEKMRYWDRWFMDTLGLSEVIEKNNAEYLNITEEILSGRFEPIDLVKEKVESLYPAVQHNKLYRYMPRKLAEYQGSPLISYGHVKGYSSEYPSLTIKNLFGLIPDPLRSWWHGSKDKYLNQSIIDTIKLYNSYFKIIGICEAINTYTISDTNGDVKTPWGSYNVGIGKGFFSCSGNIVELDAVLSALIQVDPQKVGYIKQSEPIFGFYDREAIKLASKHSSKWFSLKDE